ncbi:MAG: alpha/beta fold hydrolase [Gluconacetobacter diazotrophicus]|nr:alpha/beta fold hydrolase [Gluconacetobacter diazotrophicus]
MRRIFVEANGLRFEVLEAGTGDRLVLLLHGFPEHALSWHRQIPFLAALGFRVWAVNQRGYGNTSRPPRIADYALPELVADVSALIDVAGAADVTLVGHDWGAMVAWHLAIGRARPIDRLVIMNVPHPLCFQDALRSGKQRRKSWYVVAFQLPWLPERLLSAGHGRAAERIFAPVSPPLEVMDAYRDQLADPARVRAMLNWYRALRGHRPDRAALSRPVEVPTLMIWGENDVALDPICLDGTDRYCRDLRLHRLPGISHWVQQHAPDRVNALLREFMSDAASPWP